jgi:putative ABC transport system permease protein
MREGGQSRVFWQEVVLSVRMLRRNPSFPVLAILTLALGVGLTTAMCSVLNGTLWHPLPFPEPDQLVLVRGAVSYPTLAEWSAQIHSFGGIAGYRNKRFTLTGEGDAASVRATVSSGSLFSVLGATASLGRTLSAADDASGALPVVLSDTTWKSIFHQDPYIVGRNVYLNRVPFTIVGVMPAGFQFPVNADRIDLYTTVAADFQTDRRQADRAYPRDLQVVARLKPGGALAQAQAEMYTVVAVGGRAGEEQRIDRFGLIVPLAADISSALVAPLRILTYAIACVLITACVTVIILSLIRVTTRRGELALRLALGATRGQIARQLLVESAIIAIAGGVLGVLLAWICTGPLLLAAGPNLTTVARSQFDLRVLGMSLLIGAATAIGFGSIPALQGAATRHTHLVRDAAGPGRRSRISWLRWVLVIVEMALMVTLLAAAINLFRSFVTLSRVNPGFDPADVLTFRVDLSDALYGPQQQVSFFDRVREEVSSLRGVKSTAYTALLPFGELRFTIRLEVPAPGSGALHSGGAEANLVSPDFFKAMGIPVFEGREFSPEDVAGRPRVALISRDLADKYFPGENPIGLMIDGGFGPGGSADPLMRIVGVVGNVHNGTLAEPAESQLYVPFSQAPMISAVTFVTRLSPPQPGSIIEAIRQRVRALNPAVPIVNLKQMDEYVRASLRQPRFNTLLLAIFAFAAIFLSMTGLYAVVAYAALQRRREFSIRRALGATDRMIAWLVMQQGLQATVPGLVFGIAGASAANKMLQSVLYGVQPGSFTTMLLAAVSATIISLLATLNPARTAGRDDLRVTLQSDV